MSLKKNLMLKLTIILLQLMKICMLALRKGGTSYDVVFPSDYMIERMIEKIY